MVKSKPVVRSEPWDCCNLTPDEITLQLRRGGFWFSVSFNGSTVAHIGEFIPDGAQKTAYISHGRHGWSVHLTEDQGWNLHDRMEAEGGCSAFMRSRGLLR
jgi:hypothetical protein